MNEESGLLYSLQSTIVKMDCVTIEIVRKPDQQWGMQVSGDGPCYVEHVQPGSPAKNAGIEEGDYIFSVNGTDVHDCEHQKVVQMIAASGRIVRFKIRPSLSTSAAKEPIGNENTERFWTEDVLLSPVYFDTTAMTSSDKIFQREYPQEKPEENVLQQPPSNDLKCSPNDSDANQAVVENFSGTKATFVGAGAGYHYNGTQLVKNQKSRGVSSQVVAGLFHSDHMDEGKMIVYTTSLGVHRSVAQDCDEVRKILQRLRVKYQECDIFQSKEHKKELYRRLGLHDGDAFPDMPRVYIQGVYVGGACELREMNDSGDLRDRLAGFPTYNVRSKCRTCKGTGQIVCNSCQWKFCMGEKNPELSDCVTCGQKHTLHCPDCVF